MQLKLILFVLLISIVLVSGCSQPTASNDNTEKQNIGTQQEDITQTGTQNQPETGAQDQKEKMGVKYLVYSSISQISKQVRDKGQDIIESSYFFDVSVSDSTNQNGPTKLSNPEKTVVKVKGPNGEEFVLKHQEATQEELQQFGVLGQLSGTLQDIQSEFNLVGNSKGKIDLLKGTYTIEIDIEGDGVIDGRKDIVLAGIEMKTPTYGSKQPTDKLTIEWSQAGNPWDFIYRIRTSTSETGYNDYQVLDKTLTSTKQIYSPGELDQNNPSSIVPGMAILYIQVVGSGVGQNEIMDFSLGKVNSKVFFMTAGSQEVHDLQFKIGDFCHCDDLFRSRACTIDEIQADPLCNN